MQQGSKSSEQYQTEHRVARTKAISDATGLGTILAMAIPTHGTSLIMAPLKVVQLVRHGWSWFKLRGHLEKHGIPKSRIQALDIVIPAAASVATTMIGFDVDASLGGIHLTGAENSGGFSNGLHQGVQNGLFAHADTGSAYFGHETTGSHDAQVGHPFDSTYSALHDSLNVPGSEHLDNGMDRFHHIANAFGGHEIFTFEDGRTFGEGLTAGVVGEALGMALEALRMEGGQRMDHGSMRQTNFGGLPWEEEGLGLLIAFQRSLLSEARESKYSTEESTAMRRSWATHADEERYLDDMALAKQLSLSIR